VSKAEIFVPMERGIDKERFKNLDLSRETFGKVFKTLTSRNIVKNYTIYDIYQNKMKEKIGFDSFYAAYLTFKQLGLIEEQYDIVLEIKQKQNVKKNLTESPIYNKLMMLKNIFNAE